jgi:hypothetical protein
MDEKCEMCGAEIHSITTRRVGDHKFCRDCGDEIVLPYINSLNNQHVEMLIAQYASTGRDSTRSLSNNAVIQMEAR